MLAADGVAGDHGKEVGGISRDGGGGRDGREGDGGADDGGGDGHGDDEDEVAGIDGHFARGEAAEVLGAGEDVVAGDGVGDALGGHEAGCCCAGGVDEEEGEDGDGAVFADELDEVFGPVVGVGCIDDAVEGLHGVEDED